MWLIVGLGNPGAKYAQNRHNIGFMAVDKCRAFHSAEPERARFQGLASEAVIETATGSRERVLFLKPQTYMNESGRSVQEACRFYRIEPSRLLVFYDELDLAPGKFRTRKSGGAAGHNGIKSLTSAIGPDYWRARMGIGHPGLKERVLSHVLGDFAKVDQPWVDNLCDAVARALPLFLSGETDGFQTKVTHLAPSPNASNSTETP
jgi:peptidyl-tRNA hydrolase, PTH1 family